MMNALRIRAKAYCEHFGKDTVSEYIHDHCPGEAAELTLRTGIVSDQYNEKHMAPILIRRSKMRDRMTTFTVIADADDQVNSVPVYQMRRAEPVPAETAAAWDVVKPDGTKYTLILWNRETYRGDKLFPCHNVRIYGKAVVLVRNSDQCKTIRLKV